MHGSTLCSVSKSSNATLVGKYTFGDTFCTEEVSILEKGLKYKAVFEKA